MANIVVLHTSVGSRLKNGHSDPGRDWNHDPDANKIPVRIGNPHLDPDKISVGIGITIPDPVGIILY